ncbi:MAG: hypothetical protein IKO47_06090 [Ruminococcus sp.]|nr:hypothetical protein [Ruminococcus sp.]
MPDVKTEAESGVLTEEKPPEPTPDTTPSQPDKKSKKGRPKKKKAKIKYYDITTENDIRYRGILSYRHLKIIAWLFIILACTGTVLSLYADVAEKHSEYDTAVSVLQFGKDFSVQLLLFAGLATVLNGRSNYKKILITNSVIAFTLAALFILFYERYVMRISTALFGDRTTAMENIDSFLNSGTSNGFFSFNIFIDLTLCTLVMFFLNYSPKKYFQGKKIHIFRAFVIFPIAYEVASVCLKILASTHSVTLPIYLFPFLTTKPPASFLLFIIIARYFNEIEYQFIKHGKTHDDYEAYLKTNHNSFRFAKFVSLSIIIVSAADFILTFIMVLLHLSANGGLQDLGTDRVTEATEQVMEWGFGKTVYLLTIIPAILLFSYTKTHKNKLIDIAVPVLSIIIIVYIFFDGIFSMICEVLRQSSAAA